jgi:hypothetical protein
MLILVPWKTFVFVWGLLTAMLLLGYAVYCLQEGRNPFSIGKYHVRQVHSHGATASTVSPRKHSKTLNQRPRQNSGASNDTHATWRSDL